MAEILNVLVAFAVIVFVFRWVTSGSKDRVADKTATILGFRPKNLTPEMISTIQAMFPDLPLDNIRFDLLRTGSVERTTNKILAQGYLEAPPSSYYRVYPRTDTPAPPTTDTGPILNVPPAIKPPETLISRFNLHERVETYVSDESDLDPDGKASWADSKEDREKSLQERKAQMILAARQRMLALEKGKGKEKAP